MRRFNLHTSEFRYEDEDPDGYKSGMAEIHHALGASALAANLFELPTGQSLSPYHYEYEEEWLIVIEGTPVVRHPEGEEQLERGDVVAFPPGPTGAHKIINRGSDTARVLMFSSARLPAVAVYPDSNKVAAFTPGKVDNVRVRRESSVDYWDREP